jgi:RNA polymerase sigma factor (sigma-70 family)
MAVEDLESAGPDRRSSSLPIDSRSFEGMDEQLVRAIDGLSEDYQQVLMLWAVEELSYKEISEALDIPIGTVMSRLHRVRQKLSEELHEYAVESRIVRVKGE